MNHQERLQKMEELTLRIEEQAKIGQEGNREYISLVERLIEVLREHLRLSPGSPS